MTIDPAIAAQKSQSRQIWQPWVKPKRNDDALRSVTRAWAEKIASAWAHVDVKVLYEKVGVGASETTEEGANLIYLDDAVLLPKNAADLAAAVGVVIHEIGHLRFTIKRGDIAAQWLVERGIYRVFNTVEDGKEEMQLLALRPGFEKYLKYAIVTHILATAQEGSLHRLYPLLAGRTYMPEALIDRTREFAVDAYGDDQVDRFDELLAEFMELDPRDEPVRVVAIIEEIRDIIDPDEHGCTQGGDGPKSGTSERGPSISGDGIRGHKGRKKSKSAPKGKSEKAEETKPEEEEPEEEQPEQPDEPEKDEKEEEQEDDADWTEPWWNKDKDKDDEDEGEDEGEDEDDESDKDSEGDESGESEDGDDGGGDDAGDQSGDKGEGPTSDAGSGDGAGTTSPKVESKQKESTPEASLIEKLKAMKESLEEELASSMEEDFQLLESEAFGTGDIRRPTHEETMFQRDMVAALRRMTERAKGGLDRRRPKGRLNVRRFIQNREKLDVEKTVYDKFRPNVANALDMEIVLAVDNSGSTGGVINEMAGVLWGLTTALESVGGPSVTVVLWNTEVHIKKVPSDKWRAKYVPTIAAMGGTHPLPALKFARSVMKHSLKKQKLVFILTDGSWSNMERNALEIQKMRKERVDVYILGFGGFSVANLASYGATDACSGGSAEVVEFIFKIAEERAERVLQAHGV